MSLERFVKRLNYCNSSKKNMSEEAFHDNRYIREIDPISILFPKKITYKLKSITRRTK